MGRKKNRRTTEKALIAVPPPARRWGFGAVLANMRTRIIAGLLLVLPFIVTFWIVYWLYATLDVYVFSPMAWMLVRFAGASRIDALLPDWFSDYISPALGLLSVGLLLYFLGFVARSRVASMVDTMLLRVPIITSIYSAVSRMFQSLGTPNDVSRFKRVVLVSFPHLGMRAPAFVTSSCVDEATGKTILCVYVPTTPIPTSGYMLMVPEDEVTDLEWSLEETIQAVVSFGLTAPDHVRYYPVADKTPSRVTDVPTKS